MPRKEKFRKLKSEGIAIVGDGLCEKLYFDQMKTAEKLTSNIEPKVPKSGSWSTVFDSVDKLLLNAAYSHIYCLIDYDTVIRSKIETEKYLNQKKELENTKQVTVLECNPCFEMWFLVHFEKTSRPFEHCESVANYLKKQHIDDYDKTEVYYKKKCIYEYLKPNQPKAILNARFLEQNREDFGIKYPRAEIYRLIEKLKSEKLKEDS